MTDADLEACRAAFPALVWRWHTAVRYRGEAGSVSVSLDRVANDYIARLRVSGNEVRMCVRDSVGDALTAMRQAMTAVRDHLTAALGEK